MITSDVRIPESRSGSESIEATAHTQHGDVHEEAERFGTFRDQVLGGDEGTVEETCSGTFLHEGRTHHPEASTWRRELEGEDLVVHLLGMAGSPVLAERDVVLGTVFLDLVERTRNHSGHRLPELLTITGIGTTISDFPEAIGAARETPAHLPGVIVAEKFLGQMGILHAGRL